MSARNHIDSIKQLDEKRSNVSGPNASACRGIDDATIGTLTGKAGLDQVGRESQASVVKT